LGRRKRLGRIERRRRIEEKGPEEKKERMDAQLEREKGMKGLMAILRTRSKGKSKPGKGYKKNWFKKKVYGISYNTDAVQSTHPKGRKGTGRPWGQKKDCPWKHKLKKRKRGV